MSTRFHHTSLPVLLTLAVLATAALCGTLAAAASAVPAGPQLAMGNTVTMLIKPDGSLWAWGNSGYGQLGLGPKVYTRTRPARVGTESDWSSVQVGAEHTLALKTDGSLWAWGNNPDGRLGLDDMTSRWAKKQVGSDSDWAAIATGLRSSFALKTDGTLWAWGLGQYGRLGLGDANNRLVPTQVGMGTDWALVDGGGWHTVALKSDGTLWAWGRNNRSQLGLPGGSDRLTPVQVGSDTDWATVSCGDDDVRAMKSDGSLWAWGYNSFGQLGLGDLVTRQVPTALDDVWSLLACGDDSTFATHLDGTLWAWGDNTYGQLGQNHHDYRTVPTKVGNDVDWSAIFSGHDHAGALKPNGGLWVWGKNGSGQLGLGDKVDRLLPVFAFYATDVTAPTIDALTLTSPTHPDNTVWYANALPAFEWQASADQSGPVLFSTALDKSPVTIPSPLATATDPTWTAPQTADGTWYFHVRAGDAAGNWSTMVMRRVKIDTTAPLTTDNAPTAWGKTTPVTVHLTATDASSGVAVTEYKLGSDAWTTGTQVAVSGEGKHTVAYRSTDAAGNSEAPKSCAVRIDTRRPTTQAPKSARVHRGKTVALAYKVADPRPGSPTATVTIKIKTLSGKTVKRVTLSNRKVGTPLAYTFRCTLAKRTYRFFVYATDAAGNVQAKVGSNKLTVY